MPTPSTTAATDFLTILPRVRLHARIYFRSVRCHHRRDDAVAETVALAYRWFLRLRDRGKDPTRFPSALAAYAARAVKSGRRLCGQERLKDVLSPTAQDRHAFYVQTLPEFDTGTEENEALDALRDNHRTPPDEQAAFRLDFPAWLARLTPHKRVIAVGMAVGRYITGQDEEEEPRLFLWGIELTDDTLRPWDLLIAARERFERSLPVKRPYTEPDIGLLLGGRYLLLIEAKFTSPNTVYADGPRKDAQSLTKAELLDIYSHPHRCPMLDTDAAKKAETVAYQLWRNVQFASYMASIAKPGTVPYFANLTRRGFERESFRSFQSLVRPEYLGRVCHVTWEELYVLAGLSGTRLLVLREYLACKTANLVPAFDLGLW